MQIIAHRGMWHTADERNTENAFIRAFDAGFGVELDLRDHCGQIVVSHDIPRGGELPFRGVLELMAGRAFPLALNIKADGLAEGIRELLQQFAHSNYFTFDMSTPDMVQQLGAGLRVFTGQSDILPTPVLQDRAVGVWLDSFYSDWFPSELIERHLAQGKYLCIVSAELHGRAPLPQWRKIKQVHSLGSERLFLCTDQPLAAQAFFNE